MKRYKLKRGDRTGQKGPSRFLPRRGPDGAVITAFVHGHRGTNSLHTWRMRQAESLWKAAQTPKPGTVLANDRALKIARRIAEHLFQFAPSCLDGMMGSYWRDAIARFGLSVHDAQQFAAQLLCLCRCRQQQQNRNAQHGKRSPKRAGRLQEWTPDSRALLPEDDASLQAEIDAYHREHPESRLRT